MTTLSSVDLNLLYVLHVVLEEGSATRAAERLHVTQSAVSNSLARLRDLLEDPLVVRSGRGLVPTPRAEELAPVLAATIERLEGVVARPQSFDPKTTRRRFTLACGDNHEISDLPIIAETMAREMPLASLRAVTVDYLITTNGLESGDVDVAVGPEQAIPSRHHAEHLYDEDVALVVRRDHPGVGKRMTAKRFNSLKHIDTLVALGRGGAGHRAAEARMRELGLSRDVALAVPHFATAAMAAARTDYVAGLPRRTAETFCRFLPIRMVKPPFELTFRSTLFWHARTHDDPGACYFRSLVIRSLTASARPRASG